MGHLKRNRTPFLNFFHNAVAGSTDHYLTCHCLCFNDFKGSQLPLSLINWGLVIGPWLQPTWTHTPRPKGYPRDSKSQRLNTFQRYFPSFFRPDLGKMCFIKLYHEMPSLMRVQYETLGHACECVLLYLCVFMLHIFSR